MEESLNYTKSQIGEFIKSSGVYRMMGVEEHEVTNYRNVEESTCKDFTLYN